MRILGIDPGSSATGYGLVEHASGRLVHLAHGTLRPPRNLPLASRLNHLHRATGEVIARHAPDCVAVEQVFVAARPRSALVLGQARGAILAAVAAADLAVYEYAPTRIKRSVTGDGRAGKRQVQAMVKRLLGLDAVPASDAADALAAAISHARAGRLTALGVRSGSVRRAAQPRAVAFRSRGSR